MKYIAQTNIKHNGRAYGANDEIEIESQKDADKLLRLKAVKPCPAKGGNKKNTAKTDKEADIKTKTKQKSQEIK